VVSIITQDETNRFVTDTEKSTWNGKQDALGFTAENVSNKKTTLTDNSDTFYPSQKAVKTAVDALNVSNANYLSRFIDKMLAGQTVVVSILGDSILEGSTASVPGTTDAASIICAKLATRYNTTVTKNNVAASGDRLYNTLIGTAKYIDAVTDGSDLIIIGFGRNDMKSEPTYTTAPGYGYPLDNWKGCYEHLLRRIRRDLPDCDILILFENPGAVSATTVNALHEEQNVYLTELATLYGCAISDCYSAFTALVDWDSYLSDGSHPNDAGFKLMADTTLLLFNPTLNNVAPSNQRPFIPNILYDTAKTHLKNSWLNKTSNESVPVTANEPRYYFGGTWVGHVSSTPASYVNCIYTGSEAFLGMVCGTDQAVVDIYLDQALVWDNLDLSALSAGTRYIPIFATDEGIHSIRVVIISGTLEFDGFTVKKGNVELIKADDARITYSGTYTLNVSTSYFSLFYNTATLAITAPAGVAEFEFYGTGIGIETQRYSQTTPRGFKVTIDGGTEQTVISQTPAIALGGLYSGLVLASGLVYGRHTIRLEPVGNTTALAANGYFILGAKSAV
jgi:lysophospholipase L1-like esterase